MRQPNAARNDESLEIPLNRLRPSLILTDDQLADVSRDDALNFLYGLRHDRDAMAARFSTSVTDRGYWDRALLDVLSRGLVSGTLRLLKPTLRARAKTTTVGIVRDPGRQPGRRSAPRPPLSMSHSRSRRCWRPRGTARRSASNANAPGRRRRNERGERQTRRRPLRGDRPCRRRKPEIADRRDDAAGRRASVRPQIPPRPARGRPWLVHLAEAPDVAQTLEELEPGVPWGYYVNSRADIAALRQSLRRFNLAQLPDGKKEVLFRYWDPPIMRVFMEIATPDQRARLIAKIDRIRSADDGFGGLRVDAEPA
ncbi:DUF4123 domain-containing protein [Aestuariicoccus sp. MJ-SS9]|uniref:DUF4123 domain-containing protein n=1 Tax=Aestuariicoccus sp. MJ-SS9 TaxID=3079855 RepID=UPI00290B1607|nr:DUF4123 domain-containing protein [Aestuariicoccus sp. MJ-SS9]MDU8913463.1 DUF4123 domain-containing protein [Aestuariicoccus sp. MJ-SS9]